VITDTTIRNEDEDSDVVLVDDGEEFNKKRGIVIMTTSIISVI
jgi:hypothetical protein